jgi:hypothetical protein
LGVATPPIAGGGKAVAPPELADVAIDEATCAGAVAPPVAAGGRELTDAPPELDVHTIGRLDAFLWRSSIFFLALTALLKKA